MMRERAEIEREQIARAKHLSAKEEKKRQQEKEEEEEGRKSCCCMLVVILLVVFIVGAFSYPTVKEKFVDDEPEIVEFEY